MVNNNSGGEKNLLYGKTEKYVLELKVVLSDGNEYVVKPLSKKELDRKIKQKNFEGGIYRRIHNLIIKNQKVIIAAKPNVSKNSAGYYLWNVWDGKTFDLTKLIVGAQGTLGLVTEAKLGLVKIKKHSRMVIVFLNNLEPLAGVEEKILKYKPESFESYDDKTLKLAFKFFPQMLQAMKAKNMLKMMFQFLPDAWIMLTRGFPKLVLLAEFTGDDEARIVEHIKPLYRELQSLKVGVRVTPNEESGKKYWTIRRESFSLLRKRVKGKHTAPFIDDVIVHPEEIKEFLPKLNNILSRYKELVYTIAGHAGDANFHIIPLVDFSDPRFHRDIKEVSEKVYDLVAEYNGSITAEHNDGLIRTPYLKKMYKPVVLKLFKEAKDIFDPYNIFNPRKKVNGDLDYAMQHIKPN
jgi:FAD/FMN-containing dehydrogenase